MKRISPYLLYCAFPLLSSCALLGVHMKVTNPKTAGKYPRFSETTKLLGNNNSRFRTCFDAKFYELSVTVDEKKKYLKGKVEMTASALSDLDTLQMDLYPNLKINKISSDGKELPYFRKLGGVFISLKKKDGEKFKLIIEYEGAPLVAKKPPWKGGFVWKQDKEKNPWIGVACESEGASLWWPCKDVNNDEPDSVALNFTVSSTLTAVGNGRLLGQETNGNLTTYRWSVSYPINLYDVTLYAGKFSLLSDTYTMPSGKILPVNHYVLTPNYKKAKAHFQQAKEQMAFYERAFGEYPWYRDGYKLVESPYEGMEHQSAIAYGNGYKNSNGENFDYIVLHESAHEWWGNAVTASDFADIWLQEGFATYSEALYVESIKGKAAYLNYLLFYRIFIQNKWPVVGPEGYRYFYYKNSDCYQKGAWVLHTLRTLVDDDQVFFDIMKTFQEKYRYKTVSSQDFISLVNEKTKEDFGWFFRQYLYKREVPFLEFYWHQDDLFFRWNHVGDDFKMPAEASLDNLVKITLKPGTAVQKIPLSSQTYKSISFMNYALLFGIKENKKLRKMYMTSPR